MDTFLDVSGIVKRAKQALNFKKDSELASYLGVSRATLSNWCARNRIDFHLLLNKMRDVDLNWLLVGKGTPRHQTKLCKSDLASGEVQMIHNPKTVEALDDRSVALYDITAAANLKTLLTNKRQYMVGKIQIPSIPLCDGAVYISGDSMYVNRSEKEGCLKLVSYNAHHDPMDIPFSTINAMAIVKFSIRRHMMM